MNLDPLIRACQSAVGAEPDGFAGPETWWRLHAHLTGLPIETPHTAPVLAGDEVDPRSETNIATLHSHVRPYARALVHAAAKQGITIKITSALRTYEEQDALYNARPTVTKARAGFSNHNFGIAFDVTIFIDGIPAWQSPLYKAIGALGRQLGLEWGGDWHSFEDQPHFQLRPEWAAGMKESAMLATLRGRKSKGRDAFA